LFTFSFFAFACGHEDSSLSDLNTTENSFLIQGVSSGRRPCMCENCLSERAGRKNFQPMRTANNKAQGASERSEGPHGLVNNRSRSPSPSILAVENGPDEALV